MFQSKRISHLLLATLLVLLLSSAGFAAPIYNPGNGHYYERIDVPAGINWNDAKTAAESLTYLGNPGHLATITSAAEDAFVLSLFSGDTNFGQTWLGGFQPPGSLEPAGGWEWVTGETWSYTNWQLGEPNNSASLENALAMYTGSGAGPALGFWNDFADFVTAHISPFSYVVEFEPVPEPSTLMLLGLGAVSLIGCKPVRRRIAIPRR